MNSPRSNKPAVEKGKILLVEDDEMVREWISEVLSRSGYQVDSAEDGESGWRKLRLPTYLGRGCYDLLITDNNMPGLTGVELVARLRAVRSSIPVILATGSPPHNLEQLDLNAVLQKPFGGNQLIETVRKILGPYESNSASSLNLFSNAEN